MKKSKLWIYEYKDDDTPLGATLKIAGMRLRNGRQDRMNLCWLFRHKWRYPHYFSSKDGMYCILCNTHVLKCARCLKLKCHCGVF